MKWFSYRQGRRGNQFFVGTERFFCSVECAASVGIGDVYPVSLRPGEKIDADEWRCAFCGRVLFRALGLSVRVEIGLKVFNAELMSREGPLGGPRVRFSPRQAADTGGFRFADKNSNGTFIIDTSTVGFGSGPFVSSLGADTDDPDDDCLDLSYLVREEAAHG